MKETSNRRPVSESLCKARLHTSTSGPALHARGFTCTKSPTIDFCNYNYMHRCQSDYSIQIEGFNFTVWNRISKYECLKYENDTKNGKRVSDGSLRTLLLLRPHVCCVQCVNYQHAIITGSRGVEYTKTDYVTCVVMM